MPRKSTYLAGSGKRRVQHRVRRAFSTSAEQNSQTFGCPELAMVSDSRVRHSPGRGYFLGADRSQAWSPSLCPPVKSVWPSWEKNTIPPCQYSSDTAHVRIGVAGRQIPHDSHRPLAPIE